METNKNNPYIFRHDVHFGELCRLVFIVFSAFSLFVLETDNVHLSDKLSGVRQLGVGSSEDVLVVWPQQAVDRVQVQDPVLDHQRRLAVQRLRD